LTRAPVRRCAGGGARRPRHGRAARLARHRRKGV